MRISEVRLFGSGQELTAAQRDGGRFTTRFSSIRAGARTRGTGHMKRMKTIIYASIIGMKTRDGRFQPISLTGPGSRAGASGQPWRNVVPGDRHWALPSNRALPEWFSPPENYDAMTVQERLDVLDEQGMIYWPDARGDTEVQEICCGYPRKPGARHHSRHWPVVGACRRKEWATTLKSRPLFSNA